MKKYILTAFLAALLPVAMLAVPAKRGLMTFVQPDGSKVSLQKVGDERAHLLLTPDGYPALKYSDGFYYYGDIADGGKLQLTSIRVDKADVLNADQRRLVDGIDRTRIAEVMEAKYKASPIAITQAGSTKIGSRGVSRGIGLMDDAFLGRTELKGLVILAQYQDVKFSADCNREFYEEMLNRAGFDRYGATGSARDYFIDSSSGQFTPEFDVYGPVTLPHPMAYYGANNAAGNDKNAAQMISDACQGLDDEIDFSEYDLDGDGYVDNVFVFYAGYGEATYGSEDTIWPHQWSLSYGNLSLTLDDVRIDKYACSNELERDASWRPQPDGIGTFVHEFSHVLGLPDLYVTNGTMGEWTPGRWSVLDQGPYNNDGRTPPAYSAYERNALGWIDPIVLEGPESIILAPIADSNQACIIPTGNDNEFFLVENRQQAGWDEYLPGHGMLVWHIDYTPAAWSNNVVNNQRQHNYVDIEEARGSWAKWSDFGYNEEAYNQALADYAFPGSLGITSFTDQTTPSMKTWAGKKLSLPLTEIEEDEGLIYFNVAGGRCDAAVPEVINPSDIGDNWFEASWLPAEGATGYLLTVRAQSQSQEPTEEIVDFDEQLDGSGVLPEGWLFLGGAGALYTTEGYYGQGAPSLKLSKSGMGLMTREYDSDVDTLEFWIKGFSTNASSKVNVEGLIDGSWTGLYSVSPSRTEGEVHKLDALPEGVRKIRITYSQSLGSTALDDVKVTLSGFGYKTLAGYDKLAVGDVCSYKVDHLPAGVTDFCYRVCSLDSEGRRSAWSADQLVAVANNAGIEDVENPEPETISAEGFMIVYKGRPNATVQVFDYTGREVAVAMSDADGRAAIKMPSSGLYIVKTLTGAHKVQVNR